MKADYKNWVPNGMIHGFGAAAAGLTVADYSSKIKMVGEYEIPGENDTALAQQHAETIFTQHLEVDAILCYGSNMAIDANVIAMQKAANVEEFCIITGDIPVVVMDDGCLRTVGK